MTQEGAELRGKHVPNSCATHLFCQPAIDRLFYERNEKWALKP